MAETAQATARPHGYDGSRGDRNDETTGGLRQIAWLMAQFRPAEHLRNRHLLLFRFALLNIIALSLVGAAWVHGFVGAILGADQTNLSAVICLVFLVGLVLCAVRVWEASEDLNLLQDFDPLVPSKAASYLASLRGRSDGSRAMLLSALRLRLTQRITPVRSIAGSLVLLGLIGTVLGFIIALSGVDPDKASDIKSVSPMVSTLVAGMSTALYTTLVGAVLNLWLMANYRLLAGGTVKLITALTEFGEAHAEA